MHPCSSRDCKIAGGQKKIRQFGVKARFYSDTIWLNHKFDYWTHPWPFLRAYVSPFEC